MTKIFKRLKVSMFSVASLVLLFSAGSASAAGVLNVTNWDEYIAEDTIANFEAEYDIKVIYDVYDSQEAIDSKLLAGNSGYDVVSHASSAIARLIPADILQPFDKSKLDNFKHMRPDVMNQVGSIWDPGNKYVVPYMWGTHGVTYNEALVREVYPDAPIGSLDLIFDPVHIAKIASCGVAFLDSPTDMVPMALSYLGFNPNSTNKADYAAVEELLSKIRPYIKTFDNFAYQRLVEKEFCVVTSWGPDGLLAMSQAAELNSGVELDFFIPPGQDAASLWVDGWVMPVDAENVENAHLFLNYMMRPQVAANNTNYLWYASANEAAFDLIDPVITSNRAVFPTAETVNLMYLSEVLPPKIERLVTRTWTNFKAGH